MSIGAIGTMSAAVAFRPRAAAFSPVPGAGVMNGLAAAGNHAAGSINSFPGSQPLLSLSATAQLAQSMNRVQQFISGELLLALILLFRCQTRHHRHYGYDIDDFFGCLRSLILTGHVNHLTWRTLCAAPTVGLAASECGSGTWLDCRV